MEFQNNLIVVADFFANDLIGGAELTLEAILEVCPYPIQKIRSHEITEKFINQNKNCHWLFGNFSGVSKHNLIHIVKTVRKFSLLECDYKYCKFRSSHFHKIKTGQECDCNKQDHGRFILGLFNRASQVFFMSEGQLNEYKKQFPIMEKMGNKLIVQGSTFDKNNLLLIKDLSSQIKNDKWVILFGGSWIKNQEQTELYCKNNNLNYELVGNLPPNKFLQELSKYKGLVFHPAGFDTNPRITIEAKLLGLELDLNDNVQQKYDDWFNLPTEQLYDYLFELPNKFWERFLI